MLWDSCPHADPLCLFIDTAKARVPSYDKVCGPKNQGTKDVKSKVEAKKWM